MKKIEEPLFQSCLLASCLICQLVFGQAYNTNWNKSIEVALLKSWAWRKAVGPKNLNPSIRLS